MTLSKHLIFVVNNAAFFVSHRLPLAIAARQQGWTVALIVGQPGSLTLEPPAEAALAEHGIPVTRLAFRTGYGTPWSELKGFIQLVASLRKAKPAVVHAVTPKGVLYGGLAARLAGAPGLVLAISGMGSLFTGRATGVRRLVRKAYDVIFGRVLGHPNGIVIVQNRDDEATVAKLLAPRAERVVLIPGSGVDLARFDPRGPSEDLIVLPARMLADKGVREFVAAATILRGRWAHWKFALVGTADHANPTAIPLEQIEQWQREGVVEWWGHRGDMPEIYRRAAVVCLPSYREGMPKSLLEAAAAGRAVVTTDTIGCREAIRDGETGLLVPVGDSRALASALESLMGDSALRARFGAAGRKLALDRYGIDAVVLRTMAIYDQLRHAAAAHPRRR